MLNNDLNFKTSKDDYSQSEIEQLKYQLYYSSSNESIVEELLTYGIEINIQNVIDEYSNCCNIDLLINNYENIYQDNLNNLDHKNYIFDGDCLYVFLKKIIINNYDFYLLPDPSFIIYSFQSMSNYDNYHQIIISEKVLNAIKLIQNFYPGIKLAELFNHFNVDFEFELSSFINKYIYHNHPTIIESEVLCKLIFEILDLYDFDEPRLMYEITLKILASHGYNSVKRYLDRIISTYPDQYYSIYYSIFDDLKRYYLTNSNIEDLMIIYNTVLNNHSNDNYENLIIEKLDLLKTDNPN